VSVFHLFLAQRSLDEHYEEDILGDLSSLSRDAWLKMGLKISSRVNTSMTSRHAPTVDTKGVSAQTLNTEVSEVIVGNWITIPPKSRFEY
jgi:hypothetical protein